MLDGCKRPGRPCLLAVLVLVYAVHPARAQEAPTGLLEQVGFDQQLNAQVPLDVTFRDEQGASVSLRELFDGKPVVLALVYYRCPMLCGLAADGLVRTLRALSLQVGKDFEIVMASIDPHETPDLAAAKKDNYLARYDRPGAERGWHLLTGTDDSIKPLADAVGFRYAYDADKQQYAHAAGLVLLTPQGRVSRYFYGVQYPPRDLRLGLVEASDNQIGSLVDQVLLYCYQYDPTVGRYGLLIMRMVRIAGVATVVILGGAICVMVRRERAQRNADALATGAGKAT